MNELTITDKPQIAYSECYQQCFCSDNLELMKTIESNTIDLIYCDILYGTGRKFMDYQDLKPIRSEIENHYIPRIKEMHRILKPTGSIYLQMDFKINHWLRLILENVELLFQNEIVWQYGLGNNNKKRNWQEKHDTILFATRR
jgi:site-specific DNA-methyltransferase (adenine-specific)